MKKYIGIVRNKTEKLGSIKREKQRKKNRFQIVGKQEDQLTNHLSNTRMSENASSSAETFDSRQQSSCSDIYHQAKQNLTKIYEIQKKISSLAKARLSSFKEKENQKYDENISKLAGEATNLLVNSEKILKKINCFEADNPTQKKFVKNLELSLASQIRQLSRSLRQQQKQYFSTIRSYEKTTVNNAIKLTDDQRKILMLEEEEVQIDKQDNRNQKIHELVSSINKLSGIYKELNQLVIEQGSLVDRIDFNIEATYEHTQKAVVHLQAADQHASSPFAEKVIRVLAVTIILMAFLLGLKYMK